MSQGTITFSGVDFSEQPAIKPTAKPKVKMIEATTEMDGFTATLKALREIGVDTKKIPMWLARVIYNSGVAFSQTDKATEEERTRWRNSVIWPVKDK